MNERDIFDAALAIADPASRAAYLDQACGDDAALRKHLAGLLEVQAQLGSFLEGDAPKLAATVAHAPIAEGPGAVIDSYKLLEQIGEGGFGIVFMAEQLEPIRRRVALKILKPGMDSRQVVARFEAERQALAMMDHVNIARVLDAGTTASGRPYFVMELVHGVPITRYCDDIHLTPRERLELFVPVCNAIQHAHQKGVIHRDVKPSNVMVTLYDGKPVPKVIDFGVAKAIEQRLTERTLFTQYGTLVGTPQYVSPEQAEMSGLGVDTRSDIYSLGVLLYELLTGSTPLSHQRLREAAYGEVLRMIKEEEPPRPSTRVSDSGAALASISAQRHVEPAQLTRLLRGELDWIVMKTLEKDRNRRYETASSFAADVLRYLNDEPVQACPPSRTYRLRKFARKNKKLLATAAAFIALLVAGSIVSTWQAVRATEAERLARLNEQDALAQKEKAQANFTLARDAVDKYLNTVTEHPKLNEQDFHHLRKELLETAVPFYQKFAEQQSDDPEQEAARGKAYRRLGRVRAALGETATARADYEAARTIFAKLAADVPGVPAYRQELGNSHRNRAHLLAALGMTVEAETAFGAALKIQEQLVTEFPEVPEYRRDLAMSHNGQALLLKELGRPDEAKAAFRTALRIREELKSGLIDVPEFRNELAQSNHNLGILLKALGEREEAETVHGAAQVLYAQLVADFPKVAKYRSCLASSHTCLANLRKDLGRLAEAEAGHRAAQQLYGQLAADFPSVPEHRRDLASSHYNLGLLLKALGQLDDARNSYRTALTIQEQMVVDFPGEPRYALQLGISYRSFGMLVRETGEPQAALDWFAKAIATLEPVVKKEPRLVTARRYLRLAYRNRIEALAMLQRHDEAVLDWDRVIELGDGTNQLSPERGRTRSRILGAVNEDSGWHLHWGWPRF